MRLRFPISLLAWFFLACPKVEGAVTVAKVDCQTKNNPYHCLVQLEGKVEKGDRLLFFSSNDFEKIQFQGKTLGESGAFLSNFFSSRAFPRLFSLAPIEGENNPVLKIEGKNFSPDVVSAPHKIRALSAPYSLIKIYKVLFFYLFSFLVVAIGTFFVLGTLTQKTIDGWIYPTDELRWFFGSLGLNILLHSPISEIAIPSLWSHESHQTAKNISFAILVWCLNGLLLGVRFNDRSCIERGLYRKLPKIYHSCSDSIFLLSLVLFTFSPSRNNLIFLMQSVCAAAILYASIQSMDWRRIFKRSAYLPLWFQFSLLGFAVSLLPLALIFLFSRSKPETALLSAQIIVLFFGGWRMWNFLSAKSKGLFLSRVCRSQMIAHTSGKNKLMAICGFVAQLKFLKTES